MMMERRQNGGREEREIESKRGLWKGEWRRHRDTMMSTGVKNVTGNQISLSKTTLSIFIFIHPFKEEEKKVEMKGRLRTWSP